MLEELIFRSQQADLEAEAKRVKAARAAEEALANQRRLKGEMGLKDLLNKMYGNDGVVGLDVPKPKTDSPKPENDNARIVGRFPPPPSKR